MRDVSEALDAKLLEIPNIPHEDVPVGVDDSVNIVVETEGDLPKFEFEVRPHWELGPQLGIIDFERGIKISGSRFYVLRGAGARLHARNHLHARSSHAEARVY